MGLDIYFTKKGTKDIGYFRKVNFLVKFFNDKGMDITHPNPFEIEKKDVEELLSRCNEVLKDHSKAPELLPTMDGFFFGSTAYDEYYFDDIRRVRSYVEDELLPEFDKLNDDESLCFEISY